MTDTAPKPVPEDLCEMCEIRVKARRSDRDCPECAAIRAALDSGASPAEAFAAMPDARVIAASTGRRQA